MEFYKTALDMYRSIRRDKTLRTFMKTDSSEWWNSHGYSKKGRKQNVPVPLPLVSDVDYEVPALPFLLGGSEFSEMSDEEEDNSVGESINQGSQEAV